MKFHETLHSIAVKEGLNDRKVTRAVESFSWNITILKVNLHTHCHAQQTKDNHRTVPVCFHISQLQQTSLSYLPPSPTRSLRGRQTFWNGLWRRCRRTWSRYTMLPWPLTLVRVWQERRPAPDAAWTPSRRELQLRLEVPLRYRSRTSLPASNYILNQKGGNVKTWP